MLLKRIYNTIQYKKHDKTQKPVALAPQLETSHIARFLILSLKLTLNEKQMRFILWLFGSNQTCQQAVKVKKGIYLQWRAP